MATAGILAAAVVLVTPPVGAQLSVSFEATHLDYDGRISDCDVCLWPCEVAECELYLVMGVFSHNTQMGALNYHPGSCGFSSIDDGIWNFADQTVTRYLPDLTTSVSLFIALIDYDDNTGSLDSNDLLGTDSWTVTGPVPSGSRSNNNLSPSGLTLVDCASEELEDDSVANRFTHFHDVRFSDDSPPTTPGKPFHVDATAAAGWNDDTTMSFEWSPSADPHSGVSGYDGWFYEDGGLVWSGDLGKGTSVGACSACAIPYQTVEGSSYRLVVRARNGEIIDLTPTRYSSFSPFSDIVRVDLTNPSTTIAAPASGGWFGGQIDVEFADIDVNLETCEMAMKTSADLPLAGDWTGRTCNAVSPVPVGPSAVGGCNVEGSPAANVCRVWGRSWDLAGNVSGLSLVSYGVDWTGDAIAQLEAFTEKGGAFIPEGGWTTDRDPYLVWDSAEGVAPREAFSFVLDGVPDCESARSTATSTQLPSETLADGEHWFRVLLRDAAGNCGPTAEYRLAVDGTADAVSEVRAFTELDGEPILRGVPQPDPTPHLEWDEPTSTAPLDGYSWAVDDAVDCDVDTTSTHVDLAPLSDGSHEFGIRAIDAAGNCSASTGFTITVELEFLFTDGFESGDWCGWGEPSSGCPAL